MLTKPLAALLILSALPAGQTSEWEWRTVTLEHGMLEYALVLPPDFDPEREHPVLLALPPGDQSRSMVEAGLERYWESQARARGWVVVSPVAPNGVSFFAGSERALPELLDHVAAEIEVSGGRFHLAGVSNGGRSAFRVASLWPERFASLVVLPGYPPTPEDEACLERLVAIPVSLFVGGDDARWIAPMEAARDRLRDLGNPLVHYQVLPGEGHSPPSLDGGQQLFELLEVRHARAMAELAVQGVLDDFHAAAAEADGERYFGHFAPGAIFLGTDSTERWSVAQYREVARPHLDAGRGWVYHTRERQIFLTPAGDTAWFDERLDNEKYGELRGSGVLVRGERGWLISQYNLAFPVPNDLTGALVELIRGN